MYPPLGAYGDIPPPIPMVFSGRQGLCLPENGLRPASYAFYDATSGQWVYVRLASSEEHAASAFSVAIFEDGRPSRILPGRQAETLDQLLEDVFEQAAFPMPIAPLGERNAQGVLPLVLHELVDRTSMNGGITWIVLSEVCYILEHTGILSPQVVAASIIGPTFDRGDCLGSYMAHPVILTRAGNILRGKAIIADSQTLVEAHLQSRYFRLQVARIALGNWLNRTLRKFALLSITLWQTITAIAIWLNAVHLQGNSIALVIAWVVSLLVAVDGTLRLRQPLAPFFYECNLLRHHLACFGYAVLGGGTLLYELLLFRASVWDVNELWMVGLFILPPLFISEFACVCAMIAFKRGKRRPLTPLARVGEGR